MFFPRYQCRDEEAESEESDFEEQAGHLAFGSHCVFWLSEQVIPRGRMGRSMGHVYSLFTFDTS